MMKWLTYSWKIGHVRGVEIRFHVSVLFSVLITYYLFRPKDWRLGLFMLLWLLGFMLSILLHELAHALAAKLVGVEVRSVVIWLLGGFTNLSREPDKPVHRLLIYAAGPLITIVLGIFCLGIYFYVLYNQLFLGAYRYSSLFISLATLNIVLFVFNILPVYPLDGGKILHALTELAFGKTNANRMTIVISIPFLIGLTAFGIYTRDYILLFFCIFIAFAIGTLNPHSLRAITLWVNYLFRRGGYYFLQGDYERVAQYCTRDIERQPQKIENYLGRAVCYLWMSRRDLALADIEHALELAPKNATVLLLRADLYAMDKNYAPALELIAQAIEVNPNWGAPYIDRGSIFLDRDEPHAALEELNKGISLLPQITLAYVIRSMAHFKLGNIDAVHNDQDTALQLSEKDALVRAAFNIQAYEGYLDWAEEYYASALLKRPRSWYAYQGRADAYRGNHEHDKAIADYTRALEINPREPYLYLGRGESYLAKGELSCAVADFRNILAVTGKMHLRRQAEERLQSAA